MDACSCVVGGLIIELKGFHSYMDSHITLRHHSRVAIGYCYST